MEISAEKTKLLTNNTSVISTEIKVNGQKLETATRFKYLGSVITDEDQVPKRKLETATRFKYLGSDDHNLLSFHATSTKLHNCQLRIIAHFHIEREHYKP